jgi:hypothetical protein
MKAVLPAQKAAWRVRRELIVVMSVVLDQEAAVVRGDLKLMFVTEELENALAGTIELPLGILLGVVPVDVKPLARIQRKKIH